MIYLISVAEGVASINSALSSDDPSLLEIALQNEHVGLEEIDGANIPHYLALLRATRKLKAEVTLVN